MWKPRGIPDDARGCQCPFEWYLHPQGCLRRGVRASGSYPERTGKSGSFGMWHNPRGRLEFPREAGLILSCAGKAGNPFQNTQGNRLSCRDQEGRRGSDEAVPGLSVFPSREAGMLGNFWVSYEGCQVPFRTSGRIMGLPLRRRSGQGPHLAKTLEPRVSSRFAVGFSSDDGDYRLPPLLALGSPVLHSSGEGKLGAALSHCRAKETSSRRVSTT